MKERNYIRFSILLFWTFFWGLSVVDKIVPAVQLDWVGKDFFALFVKFFESLGIKNPVFATIALALIATIEVLNFVSYLFAVINFVAGRMQAAEQWFSRAVSSSVVLMTLFSIGDNAFGDRAQLLEHGLFWMLIIGSWAAFRYRAEPAENPLTLVGSRGLKMILAAGISITAVAAFSIIDFSTRTFSNVQTPVEGQEVAKGIYKFDMPFLANKVVLEKTINRFKETHPDLNVTYVYTAPKELNAKMKTFLLVYLFTEKKSSV